MSVDAYVGVDATLSIGGVIVAQSDRGMLEYRKEIHIFQPLGTEKEIYRRGHRRGRFEMQGAVVNLQAWAFVMGSSDITAVQQTDLETKKELGVTLTTENSNTIMFDYQDIPIVYSLKTKISDTQERRMAWTLGGVTAELIRLNVDKGFARQRLSGLFNEMKAKKSDEDIT